MVEAAGIEPASVYSGTLDNTGHAGTNVGQNPSQPGQCNEVVTNAIPANRTNPDTAGTNQTQIRNPIRGQSASEAANPWPIKIGSNTPLGDQIAHLIKDCATLPPGIQERLIGDITAMLSAATSASASPEAARTPSGESSTFTTGADVITFALVCGMTLLAAA